MRELGQALNNQVLEAASPHLLWMSIIPHFAEPEASSIGKDTNILHTTEKAKNWCQHDTKLYFKLTKKVLLDLSTLSPSASVRRK